ncbi:MAG: SRPBCC family protein [Mycobacteriales bacterium]
MELGTIEREIHVDAPPAIVFDVVSSAEHIKHWWPDDAHYETAPGSSGQIVFGDPDAGGSVVEFTVVEALPPRTFSFRWTHPAGEVAAAGNSLLVTFELTPSGTGTLLKMTETGFREMGWEAAVLEHEYQEHVSGWDFFLPRLSPYAATVAARS